MDLQNKLRSLTGRKFFGLITCGLVVRGFRHSAGLHARVILDGAASRLGELGVCDVRGVLLVPVYW